MKNIFLAILSALLLISCFPRFDLELLAWVGFVPLLLAIKGKSLRKSFTLSIFTGIIFILGVFYWFKLTPGVSWISYALLVLYLGSYFGLFGLAFNFVAKNTKLTPVVIAPSLWVTLEYIKSHAAFFGFPWALLGHSQYLNLPVIQISSFTGVYGVSFLIIMVNVAISEIILNKTKAFKPLIATIILLGLSFAYGYNTISKDSGNGSINVSVIQGNIPQETKWDPKYRKQHLEKHIRLTREAAVNSDASLILWPEASIGSFKRNLNLFQTISTLVKETKTHLLVGTSEIPKFGSKEFRKKNTFNSAILISPEGIIAGEYKKIHLVPFYEYLPYEDLIPWPSGYVSFLAKTGYNIPGNEYTIFDLNGIKFSSPICWESIYANLFRQFVKNGANFMVNISNEAQLGKMKITSAPHQVVAINVFRAVENHISIARSANTGISCFIDPYGKIIGRIHDENNQDIFVDGYLTMQIPLSQEKTFYTKYGDFFAYICFGWVAFMFALSLLQKYKK